MVYFKINNEECSKLMENGFNALFKLKLGMYYTNLSSIRQNIFSANIYIKNISAYIYLQKIYIVMYKNLQINKLISIFIVA